MQPNNAEVLIFDHRLDVGILLLEERGFVFAFLFGSISRFSGWLAERADESGLHHFVDPELQHFENFELLLVLSVELLISFIFLGS